MIPVTGRPAGWCDHIARQWPVAGVVGENGAFYFSYDPDGRTVRRCHWFPEARRAADRGLLDALARKITIAVPRAGIASDQRNSGPTLPSIGRRMWVRLIKDEINQIVAIAQRAGATVRVSSIHINIWFGDFSKLEMTKRMVSEVLGLDRFRGLKTSSSWAIRLTTSPCSAFSRTRSV